MTDDALAAPRAASATPPYAGYVLGVLVLVNVFNLIDRQILSILLESIRLELAKAWPALHYWRAGQTLRSELSGS